MYFTKTPLRISFIGGGSDLETFYSQSAGSVISVTINKYIYLTMHKLFEEGNMFLKYSKSENIKSLDEISHPIIKEVFKKYNITNVDFNSSADIPGGTGLGSSSAFTVGLINLCLQYLNQSQTPLKTAKEACEIEINKLKEPIGKQDQYACSLGGLNHIKFNSNGSVKVEKINIPKEQLVYLNNNLYLFYTGIKRSASSILKDQIIETKKRNKFSIIKKMVNLTYISKTLLENGEFDEFGEILNEGWILKKQISNKITNNVIDELYKYGISNGATGGKLLGAGAGGFILFYCPQNKRDKFLNRMIKDFRHVPFKFDLNGSTTKKL
ncbi:GHMP kinase [Flavobacteriaceae bacterium]|nr:GHMP kinase [Flavobacteriaceae bacterium]